MFELFDTVKKLTAVSGVSGNEKGIAEVIKEYAAPYADEIYSDTMGNLIVRKKGGGKKVMAAAHMDSIGMMATLIEKEGLIRFGKIGGIDPKAVLYKTVVFENGTMGVVAKDGKADIAKITTNDLYIDIGAKDEQSAREKVLPGDTAVYTSETYMAGGHIVSQYLDNRLGCYILLEALAQLGESENDIYLVFSAQEEVGLRGAKTAAYGIEPDYGIAVDVTAAADSPANAKPGGSAKMGEGAAIKVMDSSVICHREMVELMERLAGEKGIRVQADVLSAGGTDAGVIHVSRGGVVTGGISVPTRYIHSPCEMADATDIDACVQLLKAVLEYAF